MTSLSGKRIKTIGSKRKDKEPERSYANKFLSRKHERHSKVVQDRRLLMERKAGLIPDFAPQFGEQLENRNWGRLTTYPTPANIVVFALHMKEGTDFGDVESVLCVPGGHFQRNRNGAVVNIRRAYLTPLENYWMAFSHANIQPAHMFQISPSAGRFFCILFIRGMNINIGGDEAAQPVPPRRPRRGRGPPQGQASAEPHEAEPFHMRDMYMSLIDARMQSIHRGQVASAEMIIGMYDTPQHIDGPWISFIMWWHGQRSKPKAVELEQLELQLWMRMKMMMNLKMLKMMERRKIHMTTWVDEELR
ncbi:hypothetical protein LR48_Vigan07g125200 [Vigna angularis]|uniref:Uncharacterized protein n=1 Tax=Phaseolus angularis TaxID=3914 RepID=A0A0L9UXQ6_PHAAN|nr:hypothetical protein LR48_Vigan07g125200 [Vigna angularis]